MAQSVTLKNLNVYKACWISIEESKNNEVEELKG